MSNINLSSLPKPKVREELNYEDVLAQKKADLKSREPDWNADYEHEPSVKLLEVSAYDAVTERQRVNDAATSVMLPWAEGSDLDGLAAFFDIERETIVPADDTTVPPTEAVMESDDSLRNRCLLKWSSISTAGPRKAYIYHALSSSSQVKDANAYRISAGLVVIKVLSHTDSGVADQALLDVVTDALNDETVRPLCSKISVSSASIYEYSINAVLELENPAASDSILAQALANTQEYTDEQHRIAALVSRSALDAAMHIDGVKNVDLGDFEQYQADRDTAPYCTSISINVKAYEA